MHFWTILERILEEVLRFLGVAVGKLELVLKIFKLYGGLRAFSNLSKKCPYPECLDCV